MTRKRRSPLGDTITNTVTVERHPTHLRTVYEVVTIEFPIQLEPDSKHREGRTWIT